MIKTYTFYNTETKESIQIEAESYMSAYAEYEYRRKLRKDYIGKFYTDPSQATTTKLTK